MFKVDRLSAIEAGCLTYMATGFRNKALFPWLSATDIVPLKSIGLCRMHWKFGEIAAILHGHALMLPVHWQKCIPWLIESGAIIESEVRTMHQLPTIAIKVTLWPDRPPVTQHRLAFRLKVCEELFSTYDISPSIEATAKLLAVAERWGSGPAVSEWLCRTLQ